MKAGKYHTKFQFAIIFSWLNHFLCPWPDPLRPRYSGNSHSGAWTLFGSSWRCQICNSSHWSERTGIQEPTQPMSWFLIPMDALHILPLPAITVTGSFSSCVYWEKRMIISHKQQKNNKRSTSCQCYLLEPFLRNTLFSATCLMAKENYNFFFSCLKHVRSPNIHFPNPWITGIFISHSV